MKVSMRVRHEEQPQPVRARHNNDHLHQSQETFGTGSALGGLFLTLWGQL